MTAIVVTTHLKCTRYSASPANTPPQVLQLLAPGGRGAGGATAVVVASAVVVLVEVVVGGSGSEGLYSLPPTNACCCCDCGGVDFGAARLSFFFWSLRRADA